MIPGDSGHLFNLPIIVDSHSIPGVDYLSVPKADTAVTLVDRTVRALTDAIIEDKRASLRYALAHCVSIEQSRLLSGIPAEDFNAVALLKRVLDEGQAPAGIFLAAESMSCPDDHVFCEFAQPFFSGNHRYMRFSVDFIRIFAGKTHPDGFRRPERRLIGVFAVGVQGQIIRIPKCPVAHSPGPRQYPTPSGAVMPPALSGSSPTSPFSAKASLREADAPVAPFNLPLAQHFDVTVDQNHFHQKSGHRWIA